MDCTTLEQPNVGRNVDSCPGIVEDLPSDLFDFEDVMTGSETPFVLCAKQHVHRRLVHRLQIRFTSSPPAQPSCASCLALHLSHCPLPRALLKH